MTSGPKDPRSGGNGVNDGESRVGSHNGDGRRAKPGTVVDEIQELLESRSFASLEEVNAFLSEHMQKRNRSPKDDFGGLSPEQMHHLLYFPLDSPHLVSFPSRLDIVPEAPIVTLFSLLTEALGDTGMKATATGNLPRKLCRDVALAFMGEEKYREFSKYGELRSESDFFDLHVTRVVAGLSGLVRKYKGKFIVGKECGRLMAKHGLGSIYPRLFKTFTTKYNWAYQDGWGQLPMIQQSFAFTLYLLNRHGAEWRSNQFYEDLFLRAFPTLVREVVPVSQYFSPEEILRNCYSRRCLKSFAGFLGLAEIKRETTEGRGRDFRLRKLPLLDHVVRFHL